MQELRDRVAVVTGAASGIGLAMATRFAAEGMALVLADVEADALETAASGLSDAGADVLAVRTDVSNHDDVEALAAASFDRHRAVHILCNNAGVVNRGAAWEQSQEDWEWVLGVNLWGVVHGVRAFLPRMLRGGDPGHVVNTASVAGLLPFLEISSYDVSKAAVVSLSESMFLDLARQEASIGVSVLCPGVVNTRIYQSERNRPGATPAPAGSMAGSPSQHSPEAIGVEPVAELVLDAVLNDRFWVLPHESYADLARVRAAAITPDGEPIPARVMRS
jgi:NAD(P)-dependent dehydrogenase (short-subunit alcohol dehydrogenase family)